VVREGVGAGGEMNQALYAHMNNKRKRKKMNQINKMPTDLKNKIHKSNLQN
jgi:hypothetical protein